jgi:glucosamine--fructose-6-phosphate aminotransferase (isomerizing)
MALRLARDKGTMTSSDFRMYLQEMELIPSKVEKLLKIDSKVEEIARKYLLSTNFLYLGRGFNFPVALEGALKLKEISYIHADAYPAGEMKHGPIALIDHELPTIAIASMDGFEGKIKSNIQEILARGGHVYLFADERLNVADLGENCKVMKIPAVEAELAPVLFSVPLQLFSYYVAVRKGTDVDQPRNLAKSVTVE